MSKAGNADAGVGRSFGLLSPLPDSPKQSSKLSTVHPEPLVTALPCSAGAFCCFFFHTPSTLLHIDNNSGTEMPLELLLQAMLSHVRHASRLIS